MLITLAILLLIAAVILYLASPRHRDLATGLAVASGALFLIGILI